MVEGILYLLELPPMMNSTIMMVKVFSMTALLVWKQAMLSWLLDMVKREAKNIGWSRTLGAKTGAWMVTSSCSEVPITAMSRSSVFQPAVWLMGGKKLLLLLQHPHQFQSAFGATSLDYTQGKTSKMASMTCASGDQTEIWLSHRSDARAQSALHPKQDPAMLACTFVEKSNAKS